MMKFLLVAACLVGIAWMTGPTWCPGTDFADAPICAGSE